MPKLSIRYQLMLLAAFVIAVFFQTQFAEICLIDDLDALNATLSQEHFSFLETFFPQSFGFGYYRPLIPLTYWFDKQLWFLSSINMHFESVVGHLLNAILLFFVTRISLRRYLENSDGYIPLSVSLLFSVHPLVTESVNWISGRTDIMMTTFVLLSLLCLLCYQTKKRYFLLGLAVIMAGIAMLAKETALGYIIGLPLILMEKRPNNVTEGESTGTPFRVIPFLISFAVSVIIVICFDIYWPVIAITCSHLLYLQYSSFHSSDQSRGLYKRLTILAGTFCGCVLVFVAFRKTAITSGVGKISQTFSLMFVDLNYTISVFLGAIGFYVKKFFLPLPLNFFILEIDPLYSLAGIFVLLLIMLLLMSDELSARLSLVGFLALAPVLPFAFGTIAWSSYAERYLYLPSAFWLLALGLWVGKWLENRQKYSSYFVAIISLLCLVLGGITYYRNTVWKTNVDLMRDTVAQTPRKRVLREIYIWALLYAGRTQEAEHEYWLAAKVAPFGYDDRTDLRIAELLISQGRHKDALRLYQDSIQRTRYSSAKLLTAAIDFLVLMQHTEQATPEDLTNIAALEKEYRQKRAELAARPK
ncbi:MAG TPA: hypothetical protein HPP76_04480 [Desulfuromonadales bacterium]|nr:hypothetical protein [Desulfuromonadales bacterium]